MTKPIAQIHQVVVKFAGDSGDGMQLVGNQFSDTFACQGNDISTYPDYPSEIRAPYGTIQGVSGYQIHVADTLIQTPGDKVDVLVALNPAAFKANIAWVKPQGIIIIDSDNFNEKNYERAGYLDNPLTNKDLLSSYKIISCPISTLTKNALFGFDLDSKSIAKTRNQFVAGLLFWLFNRDIAIGIRFLEDKFRKKKSVLEANKLVLQAGYAYGETIETISSTYRIEPIQNRKGTFRNMTGNIALAWGLAAGAEKAKRALFLGSYPITPATEILQELASLKGLGIKTFQAEDEIAGVCTAIGASYAGAIGVTSTSGPGFSLKTEAIGLAVMAELPLVVINIQRGGPSTGLPTKTEQADLNQALYGRHGESPCVVIAPSTPGNCFDFAFEAVRLAIEHMTPVILLSDGSLANGSELWEIPNLSQWPSIKSTIAKENTPDFQPYARDIDTLVRAWSIPGQQGLEHRTGGMEKVLHTGAIAHDPKNHQEMVKIREQKVARVCHNIPLQEIEGAEEGDLLIVGWGGTYGAISTATQALHQQGYKVGCAVFNYINPLPKNTYDIFSRYKKIIVCELNQGQFVNFLRLSLPNCSYLQYNKVMGMPFLTEELVATCKTILEQ